MDFRALNREWNTLPKVPFPGSNARWIGPLIDRGYAMYVGDLSQAAYGHLEHTDWMTTMNEAPEMLTASGAINPKWVAALNQAAAALAESGRYSGPESCAERWASWLVFELSEPHRWTRKTLDV